MPEQLKQQRWMLLWFVKEIKPKKFTSEHFKRWLKERTVIDHRTSEQKAKNGCKVFSLTEALEMTDDEAERWGVFKHKSYATQQDGDNKRWETKRL